MASNFDLGVKVKVTNSFFRKILQLMYEPQNIDLADATKIKKC